MNLVIFIKMDSRFHGKDNLDYKCNTMHVIS